MTPQRPPNPFLFFSLSLRHHPEAQESLIIGVIVGGIIPLFFIPILEKFVVKSKQSFLDEAKDEIKKS